MRHLERESTIVITYGDKRWIGSWKAFRTTNPTAEITNVETLHDYKKRIKPLNS